MAYAYIGKTGILHAVETEDVAKANTNGKVAKIIDTTSINGYPESLVKKGKGIDVDTRNMTAKYTGSDEYVPLKDFPEQAYILTILSRLK